MNLDFSALPPQQAAILTFLLGIGLTFAARAAVDWLRSRARLDIQQASRDVEAASDAMRKALTTTDPKDDKAAAELVRMAKLRAQKAREASIAYEAIAKAIEALPLAKK